MERLRERAKRNHRSLQGELMAILEWEVGRKPLTIQELGRRAEESGLRTEGDSVRIIREMRDARYGG